MTSIKDVANAAGVSTATVSRVLADKPYVRPEIRDRVMAAVKSLNYRPNRVARSLRVRKSNTIGLIVSDIQNPFFTAVSRAVEDAASKRDMSVFLCNTDEDKDKEATYLKLMTDENVAGLILSPTVQAARSYTDVVKLDIPTVVIDRTVPDLEVDSVVLDNVDSAYKIVKHLVADGHRRIAAIFWRGGTGQERRAGYLKALEDHNIDPLPELVRSVKPREEEGYKTTVQFLGLPEPPDVILTSNSLLAAGAFRALQDHNLSIPDEIAFASFDDTTWTTLVRPAITVLEQPTYEIGKSAAELLLKRINEPTRPISKVTLQGKLIVRQSCGCNGHNSA
jgi:LacI family fructose operon transcriptional repressor